MRQLLRNFLWLGVLSFAWPLIHLATAIIRFGQSFEGGFAEALIFLPMGAVSGGLLIYLLEEGKTRRQKLLTATGYLLGTPLAFLGSLLGGLVLAPAIGTTLFGGLPLVIGSLIGFWLGREKQKE